MWQRSFRRANRDFWQVGWRVPKCKVLELGYNRQQPTMRPTLRTFRIQSPVFTNGQRHFHPLFIALLSLTIIKIVLWLRRPHPPSKISGWIQTFSSILADAASRSPLLARFWCYLIFLPFHFQNAGYFSRLHLCSPNSIPNSSVAWMGNKLFYSGLTKTTKVCLIIFLFR